MPEYENGLDLTERPNIFSVPWATFGAEQVPSYENASNDSLADAYHIAQGIEPDKYDLRCDAIREHFSIEAGRLQNSKSKKSEEPDIRLIRYGADGSPGGEVASISRIIRKKINLTQKEPIIKLQSSHGEVRLIIYQGHYCGFTREETKEYYWQLRYYERHFGSLEPPKFKDALLRRNNIGELSTLTATYVPDRVGPASTNISASDLASSTGLPHVPGASLGRLQLQSGLDAFDKDLAIISFIAILLRIIQVEAKPTFAKGFIHALTVGQV